MGVFSSGDVDNQRGNQALGFVPRTCKAVDDISPGTVTPVARSLSPCMRRNASSLKSRQASMASQSAPVATRQIRRPGEEDCNPTRMVLCGCDGLSRLLRCSQQGTRYIWCY